MGTIINFGTRYTSEELWRSAEILVRYKSCLHTDGPRGGLVNSTLYRDPSRSQWLRGLRRRSAAARLLRLWVRIPPEAWIFVCCECCVLSGRGLCDELITRSEESYRLWCVVVCDLETSRMRRQLPALGRSATKKIHNLREVAFPLFWFNGYIFCIPVIIKPLKLLTYLIREGNK